jgi:molecular chaperone GrpE
MTERDSDKEQRAAEAGFKVKDRRFWQRDGEEETASAGQPTYIAQLEQQLKEKDEKLRAVVGRVKEIESEYDEARARMRKELAVEVERARRGLLGELLEVVDNLDRSLAAPQGPEHFAALLSGIKMVRSQFLATLGGLGVQPFASTGQRFDPALHSAASSVPVGDPAQDGIIVGVIKEGYRIGDDVLRPATVAVGKLS